MLTGYDGYLLYLGLKFHFSPGTYDFFKYHGKINAKPESFELRNDKYFFHKLVRKYTDKDELMFFLAANFFTRKKSPWIRDLLLEEAHDIYMEKLKIKESLEYRFKEDLSWALAGIADESQFKLLLKVEDGQYPKLLDSAIHRDIEWETLTVLNACIGMFPIWSTKISDTILFPDYRHKCERYAPFLNIDVRKFQDVLKVSLQGNAK